MKQLAVFALFALALSVAPALAEETVTMSGTVLCAKCTLHDKEANGCQNVLVVGDDHYYMTKNEAYKDFGMICTGSAEVRVTGTIKEEDGHTWIVATKIERLEKEG